MKFAFFKMSAFVFAALFCLAQPSVAVTHSSPLASNGAGVKLSVVFPDEPNMGIGLGGHMLFCFDLQRAGALALYPNIEFWYASHHHYNVPAQNWDYHVSVWEFSLFLDTRYYFPVTSAVPVKPYAGLGLGPIIASAHSDHPEWYSYPNETYTSMGLNFLAGIDFPLGSSGIIGFGELKGTVGSDFPWDVFRMTFGATFPF
jgi:hypothetical protein